MFFVFFYRKYEVIRKIWYGISFVVNFFRFRMRREVIYIKEGIMEKKGWIGNYI